MDDNGWDGFKTLSFGSYDAQMKCCLSNGVYAVKYILERNHRNSNFKPKEAEEAKAK